MTRLPTRTFVHGPPSRRRWWTVEHLGDEVFSILAAGVAWIVLARTADEAHEALIEHIRNERLPSERNPA